MNLGDLMLGKRVVLHSPLPAEEVARRINAASGSFWNPLGGGIKGWCWFGRFSLHRSMPLGTNGFHPVLMGKLESNLGTTGICARFGPNPSAKLFIVLWFGFLTLVAFALVAVGSDNALWVGSGPFLLFFAVVWLLPLLFLYLANRNAEVQLQDLVDFLKEEVLAERTDYQAR